MAYPSEYVILYVSLVSVSGLNFVALFITIVYRIMPTASDGKDHETIVTTKVDTSQSAVVPNGGEAADMPLPLPVQVIERNRLTLAEILTLPRFQDYRPGEPSKVRDSLRDLSLAVGEEASFPGLSCLQF